jgi:hypothetical protein
MFIDFYCGTTVLSGRNSRLHARTYFLPGAPMRKYPCAETPNQTQMKTSMPMRSEQVIPLRPSSTSPARPKFPSIAVSVN